MSGLRNQEKVRLNVHFDAVLSIHDDKILCYSVDHAGVSGFH